MFTFELSTVSWSVDALVTYYCCSICTMSMHLLHPLTSGIAQQVEHIKHSEMLVLKLMPLPLVPPAGSSANDEVQADIQEIKKMLQSRSEATRHASNIPVMTCKLCSLHSGVE